MESKKFAGWLILLAFLFGVPALVGAIDDAGKGGFDALRDQGTTTDSFTGTDPNEGIKNTATGAQGTSTDSPTRAGRPDMEGGMSDWGPGDGEMERDRTRDYDNYTGMEEDEDGSDGGGTPGGEESPHGGEMMR